MQTLSERKVRALGIDLIFDQPTNADDDGALLEALDAFGAPAVIAIGDATNGLTPRQLQFQEQYLRGRRSGLAGMLLTGGVVRHLYPGERRERRLSAELHGRAGARPSASSPPTAPQLLYYRLPKDGAPAIRTFPAQQRQALPAEWFDG